jgi:hypothetical protein
LNYILSDGAGGPGGPGGGGGGLGLWPKIILFEHMWMLERENGENGTQQVFQLLDSRGYICSMETEIDTMCVLHTEVGGVPSCCSLQSDCSEACIHNKDVILEQVNPAAAAIGIDIVLDNAPLVVSINRNTHPMNTATEFCIRVGMNMDDCNHKLIPVLLHKWNENYVKTDGL